MKKEEMLENIKINTKGKRRRKKENIEAMLFLNDLLEQNFAVRADLGQCGDVYAFGFHRTDLIGEQHKKIIRTIETAQFYLIDEHMNSSTGLIYINFKVLSCRNFRIPV